MTWQWNRFLLTLLGCAGCGDLLHATNWKTACDLDATSARCTRDDSGGDAEADDELSGSGGSAGAPGGGGDPGFDWSGGAGGGGGAAGGAGQGEAGGGAASCADRFGSVPGYTLCEDTSISCLFSFEGSVGLSCDVICARGGGSCLEAWEEPSCGENDKEATSCGDSQHGGGCSCKVP